VKTEHNVDDVYGVNRDLPLNYVTRKKVDAEFVVHLAQRHNIVVFGSSKQGKTSLRKACLKESDYIVVSSSNKWSVSQLHASILKQVGFKVDVSSTKTLSGQAKINVSGEFKAGIPLLGQTEIHGNAEIDGSIETETTTASLELDPEDPNDIIRALTKAKFTKYIVIEDYHYLPEETQRDFAFALKTFHENSQYCFVIIGVWREKNRLIGFNGDLTERVISVDADAWSQSELREVIASGEALLNISFDDQFKDQLIENSYSSVHLVQEACRRVCRSLGVFSTQKERRKVSSDKDAATIIKSIVDDQGGRYMGFLQNISEGFQETIKAMPKWVIFAILKSTLEELNSGLRLVTISKLIKTKHPDGESLNPGNVTQILKTFASLQAKKNVRPIVADYDTQNRALYIVDRGFEIWLGNQDRKALLIELGLPAD
jgi:hypothetical protein